MTFAPESEYEALRATIRDRGTVRMCAVLGGLIAWGALLITLLIGRLEGGVTLVPLLVLAATFEINFFIHTGVERVGRYIQVFYEERKGVPGWETIAMNYGAKFPAGLDPLFCAIFGVATALNVSVSIASLRLPWWIALSLASHLAFAYRIVSARALARSQRALDLDRFRNLGNER
jgi:hypothetical protein